MRNHGFRERALSLCTTDTPLYHVPRTCTSRIILHQFRTPQCTMCHVRRRSSCISFGPLRRVHPYLHVIDRHTLVSDYEEYTRLPSVPCATYLHIIDRHTSVSDSCQEYTRLPSIPCATYLHVIDRHTPISDSCEEYIRLPSVSCATYLHVIDRHTPVSDSYEEYNRKRKCLHKAEYTRIELPERVHP